MNDNGQTPLDRAYDCVGKGHRAVAAELRAMAAGVEPYTRFTCISPWIKNVWRAAAELLDPIDNNKSN